MAKQTWAVKGRIMFRPQFPETREKYGDPVALPGVRVQVSAKETRLDPTWGEWADVPVGPQGRFSFEKEKDETPRYFRVRVMFKDDGLKLYPPSDGVLSRLTEAVTGVKPVVDLVEDALEIALSQTTRLTHDVKWFEVIKDDEKSDRRGPGTVDFGEIVFEQGGRRDLGARSARRHADIWWLAKKMTSVLDDIGCGYVEKRPLAVVHPFQSPLIGDRVESSYANPRTGVVHLIENSRSDHFNAPSLALELMHLGVPALHGRVGTGLAAPGPRLDPRGASGEAWVAFHEGFAEWAGNLIYTEIYGRPATIHGDSDARTGVTLDNRAVPFSRRFLRERGIASLRELDHYEYGWIALFTALLTRRLELHDPDAEGTWRRIRARGHGAPGRSGATTGTPPWWTSCARSRPLPRRGTRT